MRSSGRYPLSAVGDVNTYALFAEHARGPDRLARAGRHHRSHRDRHR